MRHMSCIQMGWMGGGEKRHSFRVTDRQGTDIGLLLLLLLLLLSLQLYTIGVGGGNDKR